LITVKVWATERTAVGGARVAGKLLLTGPGAEEVRAKVDGSVPHTQHANLGTV